MLGTPASNAGVGRWLLLNSAKAATPSYQTQKAKKPLTAAKDAALDKAKYMMQSAKPDQALDVLRLADVDVDIQAVSSPVDESLCLRGDLQAFLNAGKPYDANLVLKALQDSIVVRSFSIDAIPVRGLTSMPRATVNHTRPNHH